MHPWKVCFFDDQIYNLTSVSTKIQGVTVDTMLVASTPPPQDGAGRRERFFDEQWDAYEALLRSEEDRGARRVFALMRRLCTDYGWRRESDPYVDPSSGISRQDFEIVRGGDLVVLDFDRTLSTVEGFVYNTDSWDRYLVGLNTFLNKEETGARHPPVTLHDHWTFLFGGTNRCRWLAEELASCMESCGPKNVYILTNNAMVTLILQAANWLLRDSPYAFRASHVVCARFADNSKAGCIKSFVYSRLIREARRRKRGREGLLPSDCKGEEEEDDIITQGASSLLPIRTTAHDVEQHDDDGSCV